MNKLCNELDNLERRNFELERAIRDYEKLKTDGLPKLKTELDNLRCGHEYNLYDFCSSFHTSYCYLPLS